MIHGMVWFLLGQVSEGVEAVGNLTKDKGESFTLLFVGLVLIAAFGWMQHKQHDKEESRLAKRDEKEEERRDEREKHQVQMDRQNSEALRTMSESARETGAAVKIIARQSESMNQKMDQIDARIDGVQKAVEHVADGMRQTAERIDSWTSE